VLREGSEGVSVEKVFGRESWCCDWRRERSTTGRGMEGVMRLLLFANAGGTENEKSSLFVYEIQSSKGARWPGGGFHAISY